MSYDEMSDFEINKAVAYLVYGEDEIEFIHQSESKAKCISRVALIRFEDSVVSEKFDPCNNPSDAWPIIVENSLLISPCQDRRNLGFWIASDGFVIPEFSGKDKNPLRAAMICFLKMKDAENGI